jgi:hypothetical protein
MSSSLSKRVVVALLAGGLACAGPALTPAVAAMHHGGGGHGEGSMAGACTEAEDGTAITLEGTVVTTVTAAGTTAAGITAAAMGTTAPPACLHSDSSPAISAAIDYGSLSVRSGDQFRRSND